MLLWPVDIKSDGGNLLSMFASQDLNPTLARRRISSSSFTKNAGIISARRIFNLCVAVHFVTFHDDLLSRQTETFSDLFFHYHDAI